MQIKSFAVAPLAALILSACVAQTGNNVAVLQGPPVQEVITPYDIALTCLRTKMSEQNITPAFVAIGQIADRLEEPPARVAYIVSKHRFKAVQRVGIIRLFSQQQVEAIKQGLFEIQVRRG